MGRRYQGKSRAPIARSADGPYGRVMAMLLRPELAEWPLAAVAERPSNRLSVGARVHDGTCSGRIAALWCELGDTGRLYVRVYLDEQQHGSPWRVDRASAWAPD